MDFVATTTTTNEIDNITRMKREQDFLSVKLHSLQSHSGSFLQVIIQLHFVILLVILRTGTIIDGMSAEELFQDICKYILIFFSRNIKKHKISWFNRYPKHHIKYHNFQFH